MDRSDPDELLAAIELQTAVLVRNLEMLRRRSDFYLEVDRAGYLLLRTLERTGPSDIGTLSGQLGLDPSTVGRQVNAVCAAGLVQKIPSPDDLRRTIVHMTDAGQQAMLDVRRRRLEGTARILSQWSVADLDVLQGMFARYNDAIADHYLGDDPAEHTAARGGPKRKQR